MIAKDGSVSFASGQLGCDREWTVVQVRTSSHKPMAYATVNDSGTPQPGLLDLALFEDQKWYLFVGTKKDAFRALRERGEK